MKTVVQQQSKNFQTLKQAFIDDNVCLMECTVKATGEKVAAICTHYIDEEEQHNFTPFAIFLNGNPFELLTPP